MNMILAKAHNGNHKNHSSDNSPMINKKYKHSELTGRIIGCAMEVHRALGAGFQEVIYQRSLAHEFELQKIPYQREYEMPVFYKQKQVGKRRADFLV